MSKKDEVILALLKHCQANGDLRFHNQLVKEIAQNKGFGNPFDATKIDDTSKLPQALIDEDYFIVHLGKGWHRFVKGIQLGYHTFEALNADEVIERAYKPSLLNEVDTSESTVLSVINNQSILHDFLYQGNIAKVKSYGSRRTKIAQDYWIEDTHIIGENTQIELDYTTEFQGEVTIFEGKNGFRNDFAVYQLFFPFQYYTRLKEIKNIPITAINCCYVLRTFVQSKSILRLYHYTFDDAKRIDSIRLSVCVKSFATTS